MPLHNSSKTYSQAALYMGTVIHIQVVSSSSRGTVEQSMEKAFASFRRVEQVCSRFSEQSEIMQLTRQVGVPVQVSEILFETVRFALTVAELTEGVFDPTIGRTLERFGFNRHYLTRKTITSDYASTACSYQDIVLDESARTILLRQPLLLDLSAVAKGFAIDLATRELRQFEGFVIDAGGDIFAGGQNDRQEVWKIGLRHPIETNTTFCTLRISDTAVCTSGGYERISPIQADTHHIIDPATGTSPSSVVSCTVIAPFAMLADASSTAAFILGPQAGIDFLEQNGMEGCIVTPSLDIHQTKNMKRYIV